TSFFLSYSHTSRPLPSFPTRRSSDLAGTSKPHQNTSRVRILARRTPAWAPLRRRAPSRRFMQLRRGRLPRRPAVRALRRDGARRSEEHTSELQSLAYLVCRLLLEKKK